MQGAGLTVLAGHGAWGARHLESAGALERLGPEVEGALADAVQVHVAALVELLVAKDGTAADLGRDGGERRQGRRRRAVLAARPMRGVVPGRGHW